MIPRVVLPSWAARNASTVVLAALLLSVAAAAGQTPGVLRISATLAEPGQPPRPVPRHAFLISDNPPSTAPRRVVTAADGVASVRLPPGNYTVESDQPVAFQGQAYVWRQTLDVPAGVETTLALTAENAERTAPAASGPSATRPPDATDVLLQWQDSVVALWTSTAHASGVVVDPSGLIATSRQAVGTATSVEVQFGATKKVAGTVIASEAASDVAVVRVAPAVVAGSRHVPLACEPAVTPALRNGQEVVALGVPRGRHVHNTAGAISRVTSRTMIAAFGLDEDTIGGPVFVAGGPMVGLTSFIAEKEGDRRDDTRVVRVDAVCDAVERARAAMAAAAPPSAAALPLEPTTAIAESALDALVKQRAGNLKPYAAASAGFDIAFITPVVAHAGRDVLDFANWSAYAAEQSAVLYVRVTPKQVEKAWATVARGLAMTQGVALPPIKSFKPGFARMRVLCGATEIAPVHPFQLERRISETDAIREGLYVFHPDAIGPACGSLTLQIFSEKDAASPEIATVDAAVLEQIWQDFAPYRAAR